MQIYNPNLSQAYSSQLNETTLDELSIIGKVPEWLSGYFISNGPAQFETKTIHFNHWFDGFAMLKKFHFQSGKISFQNRFLRSQQYMANYEFNRLNSNEFATYADSSFLDRIKRSIKRLIKGDVYDNCNINTIRIADHFTAMTESNTVMEFKLNDLDTVGQFSFTDNIRGQLSLAHPHKDITTGEILNVTVEIGKVTKYHIYKITANSTRREIIQTYITNKPFYMHSFSITKNYVVLFKSPLVLNIFKLSLGLPFNDTLSWVKSKPSVFIIIDRRDGSIREVETDPFVCLHSANAYEMKNELILDLICHDNGNPYNYLYLSNLRSDHPNLPTGILRRYKVDINAKRCSYTILSTANQEFPRVNYKAINGRSYQFIYTNLIDSPEQKYFNAIQKLNVHTGKIQCWKKINYYPGEPVFVGKPEGKSEDDGAILSIVFNASNQNSSLIILDANTMQQIAEAPVPFHLPFGLHGNFYRC